MKRRWRELGLRWLFALGVGWALWSAFLVQLSYRWSGDGTASYYAVLDALTIPVAIALGLGVIWLLSRRWPRLLYVPEGVSFAFVLARLLLYTPLAFLALATTFGLAEWLRVVWAEDPSDSQYGVSVAWAVVWYPTMLTPSVAAVATWWAAVRKGK